MRRNVDRTAKFIPSLEFMLILDAKLQSSLSICSFGGYI
jgi:hypothetical protein